MCHCWNRELNPMLINESVVVKKRKKKQEGRREGRKEGKKKRDQATFLAINETLPII